MWIPIPLWNCTGCRDCPSRPFCRIRALMMSLTGDSNCTAEYVLLNAHSTDLSHVKFPLIGIIFLWRVQNQALNLFCIYLGLKTFMDITWLEWLVYLMLLKQSCLYWVKKFYLKGCIWGEETVLLYFFYIRMKIGIFYRNSLTFVP